MVIDYYYTPHTEQDEAVMKNKIADEELSALYNKRTKYLKQYTNAEFWNKAYYCYASSERKFDVEIMERMIKETEIYYRNGVDAVLVENYFGDTRNCIQALDYLQKICRTSSME